MTLLPINKPTSTHHFSRNNQFPHTVWVSFVLAAAVLAFSNAPQQCAVGEACPAFAVVIQNNAQGSTVPELSAGQVTLTVDNAAVLVTGGIAPIIAGEAQFSTVVVDVPGTFQLTASASFGSVVSNAVASSFAVTGLCFLTLLSLISSRLTFVS